MGQWAQLWSAGAMLPAEQEREQVVRGRVVADQLWRAAFGAQEHVDCRGIVALLRISACQIQGHLTPSASEADREALKLKRLAAFHGGISVTESNCGGDLVDAHIGRSERGPVIIAVPAESVRDLLRSDE